MSTGDRNGMLLHCQTHIPDFTQAFLCFRIRLVRFQEALEHFPVHEPTLLDGGCIIAGQQEPQKILKVSCNWTDIFTWKIRRTDRKDEYVSFILSHQSKNYN